MGVGVLLNSLGTPEAVHFSYRARGDRDNEEPAQHVTSEVG